MSALDWDQLLARHLNGEASAEDMCRLNERLRVDTEARREFVELMNLDSALAASAAAWGPQRKPVRAAWSMPRLAALAAMIAFVLYAGWSMMTLMPYASVVSSAGTAFAQGAQLRDENYELAEGSVEFLTALGARVVVEAPAAFRFESEQRLNLRRGRVAAEVPPSAKGFTVITPTGKAIDLGTKFGVDVPPQGEAEIHVFQGEVIAQSSGSRQSHSLRDGQAFSLQNGAGAAREIRSSAFIRPAEMAALSAGLAAGQRTRSETALQQLRSDPALIALLDFESMDSATCRIAQGRWPGSRAPEFVNVGDHMKLDVGGDRDWPQLTLAAWVRLDHVGSPYQSLYHTDGWNKGNPGQVHWMINRDTTMRLALQQNTLLSAPQGRAPYPDSDAKMPVAPEQGRWVHLAVVYDAMARTVRFYFNGAFDNEVPLAVAHPARLGTAQIGNWDSQDRKLSGRVDELMILGRAMSDTELQALHDAGNPYR